MRGYALRVNRRPRLTNRVYPIGVPPYQLFAGRTANVSDLTCHASVVTHDQRPHPPQRQDEEAILMLLAGEADLLLPDRRTRLKTGEIVYCPAHVAPALETTSAAPATYLVFKWRNTAAVPAESVLGVHHIRPFEGTVDQKAGEGFSVRRLFEGPTTWLQNLECHASTLAPGAGYEPHIDAHDVAIVILDGEIETLGERAGAQAVIFCAAGQAHGIRNRRDVVARYVVFEFHGARSLFRKLRDYAARVFRAGDVTSTFMSRARLSAFASRTARSRSDSPRPTESRNDRN